VPGRVQCVFTDQSVSQGSIASARSQKVFTASADMAGVSDNCNVGISLFILLEFPLRLFGTWVYLENPLCIAGNLVCLTVQPFQRPQSINPDRIDRFLINTGTSLTPVIAISCTAMDFAVVLCTSQMISIPVKRIYSA